MPIDDRYIKYRLASLVAEIVADTPEALHEQEDLDVAEKLLPVVKEMVKAHPHSIHHNIFD